MAAMLDFEGMLVVVNGYVLNNGVPYFQRAVPIALQDRFGKKLLRIRLHERNGHFAVQCRRLWEGSGATFRALEADARLKPNEVKSAAASLLAEFGLLPGDGSKTFPRPLGVPPDQWDGQGHIDAFVDWLNDKFNGRRTAVTDAALAALKERLPCLLSEAFDLYLENHKKANDKRFAKEARVPWDRFVHLVGDKALEAVDKSDAKRYRDHRLGQGVTAATVTREVATLKAVIASAISELGLTMPNPFVKLTIVDADGDAVRRERRPYTREQFRAVVNSALAVDDSRRRIVLVTAFTGARLAEVVGLQRKDVDLTAAVLHIRANAGRSLKTSGSARTIPLLPVALEAIKQQLDAHQEPWLFPEYSPDESGRVRADSASATLVKWIKGIAPGQGMHSFRHTFRDFLRTVECPEAIAKALGGWTKGDDVSTGYGVGYSIEVKRKWLKHAYAWIEQEK